MRVLIIISFLFFQSLLSLDLNDDKKIVFNAELNKKENNLYNQLNTKQKQYLKAKKRLLLHTESSWEPYNFVKDNKAYGFTNDLMRLLFKDLPIELEFVYEKTWQENLDMLKQNKLDIISDMVKDKQREKNFIFSNNSMFNVKMAILSKNNYKNITDLNNKKVAIIKGYYTENILKEKYPLINVILKNSFEELLQSLINNEVDAILEDHGVINNNLNNLGLTSKFYNNILLTKDLTKPLYIGINKNNTLLKSIIDLAFSNLDKDEYIKLYKKWNISYFEENNLEKEILNEKEKALLKNAYLNIYVTNWEPFTIHTKNGVDGISVDFWKNIISKAEISYQYIKDDSFNDALNYLKKDKNAIIIATSSTKDREIYAAFTKPIISFPIAIATKSEKKFIMNFKELDGKSVAVGKNYSAYTLLKEKYPNINFVPVKDNIEAVDLLAQNKVYAAADILPVLIYTMNKYHFTNIKISGTTDFNVDIKFMLNKNKEDLIPILNKLIDNIDENTRQNILNRWIYTKEIESFDYTYFYLLASFSFLIISFILYRQKLLNRSKYKIEQEKNKLKIIKTRFENMFRKHDSIMLLINPNNGLIIDANDSAIEFYGYSWSEFKQMNIDDINILDSKVIQEQRLEAKNYKHNRFVFPHKLKDNSIKQVEVQSSPIESDDGTILFSIIKDITKEKELEKQIIKERDFVSNIINNANAIIATIDAKGLMYRVNKYTQDFTGYTQEEIASEPFFWDRFLSTDKKELVKEIIYNAAKKGEITKSFKNSWISKNNEKRIFEWSNTLVKKIDGSMDYVATIGIDVTDKELIQKKIFEQKEEFEAIFKNSKDGIAITDLETNFIDCNEAYLEITGYTKEELLTLSIIKLSTPEYVQKTKEILKLVLEKGHINNFQKENIVNNKKRINVNISISLMPDKKRLLIITKDVTDIKLLEEENRLASLDEMISNIAHQWRQPLSVITSGASSLQLTAEFGDNFDKEFLNYTTTKIVEHAQYLSKTIDDFKNFVKKDSKFRKVYVKEVIQSSLDLVEATLKNNFINIKTEIDHDMQIYGNKNDLQQALINIYNNSKEFLIKNVEDENDRVIFLKTNKIDNNHLELKILDSAGGINENIINKIFDPYFTTKHKSIGVGLGLSTSEKIIRENHHYSIRVYNEEFEYNDKLQKGACFNIIFKNGDINGD